MKELEKVKQISISSVLFILAVIIGLLIHERPENPYAMNSKKTLENLVNTDYIFSLNQLQNSNVTLVDVRTPHEFEKGHLDNAINIPTPDILKEENLTFFREMKDSSKQTVLYGKDLEEANLPFLMLYQLGYDNLRILSVDNSFMQNNLVTKERDVEKPVADIKAFIEKSVKDAEVNVEVKKEVPVPKKIIPVIKKKKRPVEGGC